MKNIKSKMLITISFIMLFCLTGLLTYADLVTIDLGNRGEIDVECVLYLVNEANKRYPDNEGIWLSFNNNDLTDISITFFEQISRYKIVFLDFSDNFLSILPPVFSLFKDLLGCDFSNNQLKKIPESLLRCSKLMMANFSNNLLTFLPSRFGLLNNLEELFLEGNQFHGFPEEILKLFNLERLYLGGNQLQNLPPEIWWLPKLKVLDLRFNRLEYLPPVWKEVNSCLDLFTEALEFAIEQQDKNVVLEELYLANNLFQMKPDILDSFINLKKFDLSENPLLG